MQGLSLLCGPFIRSDLKPENVLIGSDGHIVLSDFGLSKEFPSRGNPEIGSSGSSTPPPSSPGRSQSSKELATAARSSHWLAASEDGSSSGSRNGANRWADERDVTTTFCGTAEYLAPEVIQGSAYSYEVDWWSFGTMLYEMLTGITPFWADTHADMYVRVLHDELVFPEDRVLDQDTKSILRGLLQRNPVLRMKEPRIKKHPYFSMIEWAHVFHKRYIPPYVPPINPLDETDTQNFDEAFLDMQPTVANGAEDGAENEPEAEGANAGEADAKVTGEVGQDAKQVSNENTELGDNRSLFDGYSFRGRRDSESVKSSILSSSSNPEPESVKGQEESEDEETAARAAVAALARLESEANAEEAASSPSANSMSTRPTSATLSGEGTSNATSDSDEQGGTPATKARSTLSAVGVPANEVIEETDDEDEDWDLVDAAPGTLQSEVNGGKGANLFARGVVDTYRLLRRQESSRIPPSPSQTSSRGFSRLSKRGPSSRRNISKASEGNLTSVSAASVDSNTRSGGDRSAAEDEPSGSEPTPSGLPGLAEAREKQAGSPSLASSDDHASQERRKRFKKRFTTFFDPPSVR